jgi:organic hydroperoxide reductase OsmC/OhrA
MDAYPHRYAVRASAYQEGTVNVGSDGLPDIVTAPPSEFGGPGDRWSPETLLVAAVADCFVLSFRGVARASKLDWGHLAVDVEGTLDRQEGGTRFTGFLVRARLRLLDGVAREDAERALHKAERSCLITNSLSAPCQLETELEVAEPATG